MRGGQRDTQRFRRRRDVFNSNRDQLFVPGGGPHLKRNALTNALHDAGNVFDGGIKAAAFAMPENCLSDLKPVHATPPD